MRFLFFFFVLVAGVLVRLDVQAQTPPSPADLASYEGLFAATAKGDVANIKRLIAQGADVERRDASGRTPLHVAAFQSQKAAFRALIEAEADANALDASAYDAVTIAAVANDLEMMNLALASGNKATNITSPYEGTALIAAAHLGHAEIVKSLIEAGAPLDHINNLGWTALIEVVVLGDGGDNHLRAAKYLLEAGADPSIGDRQGVTPLAHAEQMGFVKMADLIRKFVR